MIDLSAERRLVKSPPELWAEISDPEALAKHLAEFGEIRIVKVVPEHTVVWKGDLASGVARIESSGWGTKVVLSAEIPEPGPEIPESPPQPEPSPQSPDPGPQVPEPPPQVPEPEPEPGPEEPPPAATFGPDERDEERMSLLARLFGVRWSKRPELQHLVQEAEAEAEPADEAEAEAEAPPQPEPEPDPEPEPEAPPPPGPVAEPEAEPVVPPEVAPEPQAARPPEPRRIDPERVQAVLDETLEALGTAHHRPFSRA